MSKAPEFWQRLKRKSDKQVKSNNNVVLYEINGRNEVLSEDRILTSVHQKNISFPDGRSYNKNSTIYNDYYRDMENEQPLSKGHITYENSNIDKTTLDKKYIENLLHYISELKDRINFDNRYKVAEQTGDYNVYDFKRLDKKHNEAPNVPTLKKKIQARSKLTDYNRNVSDHGRGIYTVSDPNKSNTSLIMSLHSTSRNTFVKVNPNADTTRSFQDAAEEFIKQAEGLKNKITCMLDCCTCESSTYSDRSVRTIASDDKSTLTITDDIRYRGSYNEPVYDQNVNSLLGSLNSQYEDILRVLTSIEKQMKALNKKKNFTVNKSSYKKNKQLSATSANVSAYTPDNGRRKPESSAYTPENGRRKPESSKSLKKAKPQKSPSKKGKNANPHLDPVVLIYEPIRPTNGTSNKICMHCNHGIDDTISNKSLKNQDVNSRKKKENVNYGFVVSYTPNISSNTSTMKDKESKSEKKKIFSCCG